MKNILLLTLTLSFTLNSFSQSNAISIDNKFEDWNSITTYTDTNETLTGIDILETQVTNDNNYLYIRIKTNNEFSLTTNLIPQNIRLFIDTDNDENTGFPVQAGFGSELGIVFQARFAYLETDGNNGTTTGFANFGFKSAPTVTSNEFEIAIDRNSIPDGTNHLFTSSTIRFFWQNSTNYDRLPNTGNFITYTFDDTPVIPYTPIEINKTQSDYIRVCSYNTLNNGIEDAARVSHFEKVIKAINPDLIAFQEFGVDYTAMKNLMDTWLPLGTSNGWYVHSGIISKWEITGHWTNFTNENPINHAQYATLIDLPNEYGTDLLLVNSHLDYGFYNAERQNKINAWNGFLVDAKTTGGNIDLPTNTPIVYVGDLNLVGYSQQLTSLLTGIDENGNGVSPDWDDSNLESATALQADINMYYTWREDTYTVGNFPPGKLDYILYTGSVLNEEKSFVLQTEEMPSYKLALHNLDQNNTSSASDHFPIVADFSISSILSLLDNNLNKVKIYPNPTNKILNVEIKNSTFSNIELFDVYGKLIQTFEINSTTKTINIEHLNSGVYFIQISNNKGEKITRKLIKK